MLTECMALIKKKRKTKSTSSACCVNSRSACNHHFSIARVLASEIELQVAFASLNGKRKQFLLVDSDKTWEQLEKRISQIHDIQMKVISELSWTFLIWYPEPHALSLMHFLINIMFIMKPWFGVCRSLKTKNKKHIGKKNRNKQPKPPHTSYKNSENLWTKKNRLSLWQKGSDRKER